MVLRALLKLFIVIPVLFTVKWWYRGLNLFVYIGCGITFSFARISNRLDLLEYGWFKMLTEWVGSRFTWEFMYYGFIQSGN